jgi:uncharacterized secreted protein with C-terminal beta-propeller domain
MRLLKSTFILSTTVSLALSNYLSVEKGWKLIGFPQDTTVETIQNSSESIEKIYFYKDNSWQTDGSIESYDGVWIYSTNDENIYVDNPTPKDSRDDDIKITKGWNLISLPINTTITPKIFKDFVSVWKYKDSSWEFYSGRYDIDIPQIESLGGGEGFWVNSEIDTTINLGDSQSELIKFDSNSQMTNYIDSMVKSQNYITPYYTLDEVEVAMDTADTATDDGVDIGSEESKVSDTTSTNLQETNVDEADIIKHNGDSILYLKQDDKSIFITSFDKLLLGDKTYSKIETSSYVNEMFLVGDYLITISPNNYNFYGFWSDATSSSWVDSSQVEIFDISNIDNVQKINSFTFDGNIVDSRVTNSKLYLVTRYMPYVDIEYPKIYIDCANSTDTEDSTVAVDSAISDSEMDIIEKDEVVAVTYNIESIYYDDYCYYYSSDESGYYNYDYNNPIYKDTYYIPTIKDDTKNLTQDLIDYTNLYAPIKIDQNAFITSILEFNIDEDIALDNSVSFIGNSNTLYASNSAIYLVSQEYNLFYSWYDYKQRSAIYKFSIDDGLEYSGREFIDGYTLNQFSLSEYSDILRVASTTGYSWMDNTDNIITTLKEDSGTLKSIGRLDGLGESGETIKGVRFLQNRGFVVTFKQTDPLYTIDLADPTNPKKVGELKIDGYSSYFHPIDDNRILSVGVDANSDGTTKGVQLELFDISDFTNPTLANKVTIGEDWNTSSEAVDNHKAFTFRDSDMSFAIPISIYNYNDGYEWVYDEESGEKYYSDSSYYEKYLDIYRVNNLTIEPIKKVSSTNKEYSYNSRSIIFTKDEVDYAIFFDRGEFFIDSF